MSAAYEVQRALEHLPTHPGALSERTARELKRIAFGCGSAVRLRVDGEGPAPHSVPADHVAAVVASAVGTLEVLPTGFRGLIRTRPTILAAQALRLLERNGFACYLRRPGPDFSI